ncbi:hypothetical protein FACS1894178_8720 [Bacteroidia bacterium]|nr:hypothetical protein FACS1894178_8720 [Bacteroidia bacterium]
MKKILITLSLIACAALLSAQTITLSNPASFSSDATVVITAKATVPDADTTNDQVCSNPAGTFDIWIPTGTLLGLNTVVGNTSTLEYTVSAVDHTLPAGYSANNACAIAFDHYTISVADAQSLNPGYYKITLPWADGACADTSSTILMQFTIKAPAVPIIAMSDNICETTSLVLTTTWADYATGTSTTAPYDLEGISITDYVVHHLDGFCCTGEWLDPAVLGFDTPLVLDNADPTNVDVNGLPGKTVFHINEVTYTTTSCGTVAIKGVSQIAIGTEIADCD